MLYPFPFKSGVIGIELGCGASVEEGTGSVNFRVVVKYRRKRTTATINIQGMIFMNLVFSL